MKRSRRRWLGLTLFCVTLTLLSLELPSTSALKATSLIHAKTTTTTTAAPEEEIDDEQLDPETADNSTINSKLTGIPQMDYIYDPNLPRELNGYNLSEYPFLETVPKPELIDFKCEGLHDGFYASIPLKCQVYHHCLFGTRYDFLCANYTAFDQKTFICQFVSEVDCKNSPNYWNRNEALYKATTTTAAPTQPTTTTTTTTPRPRPVRRRRPYYDDYDDEYYSARDDYEYDDRPRRRPRPGNRQGGKKRPVDDYDDERYDRRRPGTARGRPSKRPYDRRTYEEEEEDRRPYRSGGSRRQRPRDEIDDQYEDEVDREPQREDRDERPRRPINEERETRPKRPTDEVRAKRPIEEPPREEPKPKKPVEDEDLRPLRPVNYNRPRKEFRPRNEKPIVEEEADLEPKRERDEVRTRDETRPRDERPKEEPRSSGRDEYRPREEKPHNFRPRDERRPYREDHTRGEDRYQSKGRRYDEDRPRDERPRDDRPRPFRERNFEEEVEEKRPEKKEVSTAAAGLVKPAGSGIFAQPRMPPKIKRPVPINAKEKFEYVPIQTTKPPKVYDDEYDDYDDEDTRRPSSSGKSSTIQQRPIEIEKEKFKPSRTLASKPRRPIDYEEEYYDEPPSKNFKKEIRNKPKEDYYYDDEEKEKPKEKEIETKVKNVKTNVRVVKRPFLPSRGGSPYLPRGLKPVAGRDMTAPINTTPKPTTTPEVFTNPPTQAPTTRRTTRLTTRSTTRPTTTVTTQQITTEHANEEYEYYEDEDYDKIKESTTEFVETTTKAETTTHAETTTDVRTLPPETTTYVRTLPPETTSKTTTTTTTKPTTTTTQTTTKITTQVTTPKPTTRLTSPKPTRITTLDSTALHMKNLDSKMLQVYNERYEAMRDKLTANLSPTDFINPYLATTKPAQEFRPKIQINPEISKPYTATGKPLITENFSIKQNLADSIENDYDVRINEALAPKYTPRIPTGFSAPDRDYTFARYRNIQPEPQYAASEISNFQVRKRQPLVSIRTPNSYFIQPQRMFEDLNRYPRHLLYRPEFF